MTKGSARSPITPRNFRLWFGGIWLFCASPFRLIGLYLGYQERTVTQQLESHGKTVEGMVTRDRHQRDLISAPTHRDDPEWRQERLPVYPAGSCS